MSSNKQRDFSTGAKQAPKEEVVVKDDKVQTTDGGEDKAQGSEGQENQPNVQETSVKPEVIALGVQELPKEDVKIDEVAQDEVVAKAPASGKKVSVANLSFDDLIANLKENGTVDEKVLIQKLEAYLEALMPGRPITGHEGVVHQYALLDIIFGLAEAAPAKEFNKLWSILIKFFDHYRNNGLGPIHSDRFTEYWGRSKIDLHCFLQMTNLLRLSVTDRGNLNKLVKMENAVAYKFTELGRGRIVAYYA